MRILLFGQCFCYHASGFASNHCCESRDLGLARGLARLGYSVDLLSRVEGSTDDGLIRFAGWDDVKPLAYDAVIFIEIRAWDQIQEHPEIETDVRNHPNVMAVLDSVHDIGFVRCTCYTTPALVADHKEIKPNDSVFHLPWACPVVDDDIPNPYPDDADRVIYIGCVLDRYLAMLTLIADRMDLDVWIAGLFKDENEVWGGLTDAKREEVAPNLRFVSDEVGVQPAYGSGPVRYGDLLPYIVHSKVALNFAIAPNMHNINAKLYDYLGCGCPVVSEQGPPNNGDLILLNAGEIVPRSNLPLMMNAISRVLMKNTDRSRIRREARAYSSWDKCARLIDQQLRSQEVVR